MTEYNDWKIWNGGECPVPDGTMGQVQNSCESRMNVEKTKPTALADIRWAHVELVSDIIAYRTVKEPVVTVIYGRAYSDKLERNYPIKITITGCKVTKVDLAE